MKITLTQFRPNTAEAVWTDCFAQAIAYGLFHYAPRSLLPRQNPVSLHSYTFSPVLSSMISSKIGRAHV